MLFWRGTRNRLARNSLDDGQIIHFLDIGKIINLRFPTYTFENTPQGKFMLAIIFGQSKYQVSGRCTKREHPASEPQEARKGGASRMCADRLLQRQIDHGREDHCVGWRERFSAIKRLWELFLSDGYSIPQQRETAEHQLALRTLKRKRRGGSPLCASGL
jgi:site-specific DNA recombinase